MGKPKDPDYFKKYRATHPEYAARDRARRRARKERAPRGDRTAEYAKRKRPPVVEPLAPADDRPILWNILLQEDLVQELELAKLERKRDPKRVVDEYRRREFSFIYHTRDLTYFQSGEDIDD